jgi:diguanylate cyclase (GGDEF)-like protein
MRMGMDRATPDHDVDARRDLILANMARSEARLGAVVVAFAVSVFLVLHRLLGEAVSRTTIAVDSAMVLAFLALIYLLREGRLATRHLPAVIGAAVFVAVLGQTYDYTVNGEQWAPVIILAMSGTVVLDWRAFWTGSLLSGMVAAGTYLAHEPEHGVSWAGGTVVAILAASTAVRSRRNIARELAEAQLQIEQIAIVDPLTTLLNRRGLAYEEHFIHGMARRRRESFFAVFIDVGGLKRMNDRHGHAAGDRLLVEVAHAVRRIARETDLACRWGGDEFLIVGVGICPDASTIMRRLLAAMDVSALPGDWDPVLWVGTAASSSAEEELEAVIERADENLYANRAPHDTRTR